MYVLKPNSFQLEFSIKVCLIKSSFGCVISSLSRENTIKPSIDLGISEGLWPRLDRDSIQFLESTQSQLIGAPPIRVVYCYKSTNQQHWHWRLVLIFCLFLNTVNEIIWFGPIQYNIPRFISGKRFFWCKLFFKMKVMLILP